MKYVKWTIRIVLIVLVAGVLQYNLPDRDIVRIVNTEVRRVDFGSNSVFWQNSGAGDAVSNVNRDVFFIETIQSNGAPLVFRNEDTGWGWPPYFKFDTADLQTQARNLVSSEDDPQWVAVRHYGWRNQLFSIFPNATSVEVVPGPDTRLIPWFNIVFLSILTILGLTIWRLWRNFRQARIDPVFDEIEETSDEVSGWFGRQIKRILGRPR